MKYFIKTWYMRYLNWVFERQFRKWCKFAFRHALYPITIDEEYLKRYIDWNKEWKKKYGIDLRDNK